MLAPVPKITIKSKFEIDNFYFFIWSLSHGISSDSVVNRRRGSAEGPGGATDHSGAGSWSRGAVGGAGGGAGPPGNGEPGGQSSSGRPPPSPPPPQTDGRRTSGPGESCRDVGRRTVI